MSFIFCCCMYDLVLQPTAAALYVECLAISTKIGCWGWGLDLLYTRCFQERRLGLVEALACSVPLDATGLCVGGSVALGGERRRGGGGIRTGMDVQGEFGQLLSTFVIGVEAVGELLLGWGGVCVYELRRRGWSWVDGWTGCE